MSCVCVCVFIFFLFRSLTTLVIPLFFYSFIYLFIFGCAGSSLLQRLFSHFDKQGYSLVLAGRLLVAVPSLVAEARASGVVALGLSSCGSRALEHRLHSCDTWA